MEACTESLTSVFFVFRDPEETTRDAVATVETLERAAQAQSRTKDQATQADGCHWSFGHTHRQVLTNVHHLTIIEPPPGGRSHEDLSSEERSFATRVDADVQRRVCDCALCVRHAV